MIYSIKILILNTICIRGNMGNLQIRRTFCVAFIGADYDRWLWSYIKIMWFTIFVRGGGGGGGWCKVLNVCWRGVTKIEQVRTRGNRRNKFWSFYDNVIIECPLYYQYHFNKTIGDIKYSINFIVIFTMKTLD